MYILSHFSKDTQTIHIFKHIYVAAKRGQFDLFFYLHLNKNQIIISKNYFSKHLRWISNQFTKKPITRFLKVGWVKIDLNWELWKHKKKHIAVLNEDNWFFYFICCICFNCWTYNNKLNHSNTKLSSSYSFCCINISVMMEFHFCYLCDFFSSYKNVSTSPSIFCSLIIIILRALYQYQHHNHHQHLETIHFWISVLPAERANFVN